MKDILIVDDGYIDIILFDQVVAASDCAKQCADEPQCHGWSHFAPAKRYNDDDNIMTTTTTTTTMIRCYIKSSLTGPMVEFPGTESGPKPCKSKSKN